MGYILWFRTQRASQTTARVGRGGNDIKVSESPGSRAAARIATTFALRGSIPQG